MKCVWLLAALSAASVITGVGCGDPTTAGGTALNLDRPIDVAFACYGAMRQTGGRAKGETTDPVFATAQPPAACQALSPPLSTDTITPAPGQETISGQAAITPSWYAFILQSATGTVALTRWAPKAAESMIAGVSDGGGEFAVLDGDSLTPAKNAISVGEDPIAIATDKAGCFEVTANAGSCDLSELDINSALDDIQPLAGKAATPVKVDRVRVTNATATPTDALKGVILARPAAMVAESPITVVGNACPATATGRIYIAYPSCHLVAGVDAATGKIVAGITFDAAGTPSILSGAALDNVSCPDECANAAGVFANGPVTAGARPVALALQRDTRAATNRLAIGADNSASITVVDLDPTTSAPTAVFQVPLENTTGKLGVTAVSLSPQIAMGGNAADPQNPVRDDVSPGGQAQYVYAIATDGTVRVADVLTKHKECDTQVDARFVRGISDVSVLSCLPVGAPATPQRRSGARGPGIELPFGAVPTSVAIVKGRSAPKVSGTPAVTAPAAPTNLLGTFAIVTTSSGVVYVVNIDDDYAPDVFSTTDPVGTAPVLVMAHQLRDSFSSRGQGPLSDGMNLCKQTDPPPASGGVLGGGPRPLLAPSQTPPSGTIAADKVLPLPSFHQLKCPFDETTQVTELDFLAPLEIRDAVFPDLGSVFSETWRMTWEGLLSLDNVSSAIDGPQVRSGQLVIDGTGMHLRDPSRPFCELGVEPFDVVDLRGCSPANGDSDCPAGYTCYVHPRSVGVGVGACMLKSEAPRLADACFEFLTTARRYTVGSNTPGELQLLERKHELQTTPIDGCLDDTTNQCDLLAQDTAKIDASADPFTSRTHWSCQADPLRAPVSTNPARNKRCVQVCSTDPGHPWDCGAGTICRPLAPNSTEGVCMEGVEPPQACVNGPQRFDARASEAFTVVGSRSGYVHPIVEKPAVAPSPGNPGSPAVCVIDPTASPVQRGRIPLRGAQGAPLAACDPTANPITGQLPGGGFEANPCVETVTQFDSIQQPASPACAATKVLGTKNVPRSAQAIKFRNRAMRIDVVDPYQSCLPSGQGALANVPLVNRGYSLEYGQKAGYTPLIMPVIAPSYPVKVVRGPTDSIWVIDDGDFLSNSITLPSTRGRVFRIESVDLTLVSVIQ